MSRVRQYLGSLVFPEIGVMVVIIISGEEGTDGEK
jgi:hypothetical protein